jgi:heparosan-N-sulfate-glucuronate 5-epimerase
MPRRVTIGTQMRRSGPSGRVPSTRGGAQALLGGGPFYEEYPTDPPSFVLNGAIFALWGVYDVSLRLDADGAGKDFADALAALASNIERWDCGYWSLYDLFPHPVPNVASSAYHSLHTTQLRAMQLITPRPEFERTADTFERYASSRASAACRVLAFWLIDCLGAKDDGASR